MKRCYVPDKNACSFLSTLQQQQKNQAECLLFAWTINVAIITINTWNYYPLLPITMPIIPPHFHQFWKNRIYLPLWWERGKGVMGVRTILLVILIKIQHLTSNICPCFRLTLMKNRALSIHWSVIQVAAYRTCVTPEVSFRFTLPLVFDSRTYESKTVRYKFPGASHLFFTGTKSVESVFPLWKCNLTCLRDALQDAGHLCFNTHLPQTLNK